MRGRRPSCAALEQHSAERTIAIVRADRVARDAIRTGPARHVTINRGGVVTFNAVPDVARVVEPPDALSGQPATSVASAQPLDIQISQGTEAQELPVDIHLALTTVGGESSRCALAGSWVQARVYPSSTRTPTLPPGR